MSTTIPTPPYPKPPIIESVIHLAVVGNAALDELQKLARRFAKDYPQQQTLTNIDVTLNTTGGPATVQQRPTGFRVLSVDQADLVLLFPDGVATARLAPYPGWEHLRDRARTAWGVWRRNIGGGALKRIGVRYINRVDVPIKEAQALETETYLRVGPRIPDFSKHALTGYVVQATRPTELEHWSVSVTSSIVSPAPLINRVSLLLDIDIFRIEQIPGREAELWECIEQVRPLKNAIFEACITDDARRLFV
jgi:uncharacterized protein (TIGR04255 family)